MPGLDLTPTPGRRALVTVPSGGRRRSAVLYVPAAAPGGPLPLVLTLHGSGSGAAEQMTLSGLEALADRRGIAVVAPEGAIRVAAGFAWNVPHIAGVPGLRVEVDQAPDDERFLLDLVDALASAGIADPERVYATGLSGGGRMVCQLAADHPDRLAGIAPVAGLRAGAPLGSNPLIVDPATFRPATGVPVIAFHGTQDPVNPFDGGGAPYWGYPVLTALERWAEANGCAPEPVEEHLTEHVSSLAYAPAGADGGGAGRGTGRTRAVLYVVEGGGHTWPGSRYPFPAELGPVTGEIDATDVIWEFFESLDAAT